MKPKWPVIALVVALCAAECARCPFEQGTETPDGRCVCRYRPRITGESGPLVARGRAQPVPSLPPGAEEMVALDPRFEENR